MAMSCRGPPSTVSAGLAYPLERGAGMGAMTRAINHLEGQYPIESVSSYEGSSFKRCQIARLERPMRCKLPVILIFSCFPVVPLAAASGNVVMANTPSGAGDPNA